MFDDFVDETRPCQPDSMAGCYLCSRGPSPGVIACRGDERSPVVIVGEAPGREEVALREVFVGPSGQLLDLALEQSGLAAYQPWITNTVKCDGAKPSTAEIQVCGRQYLFRELWQHQRRLVIALGAVAQQFFGYPEKGVTDRVGHVDWSAKVAPCPVVLGLHPAYILRNASQYTTFESVFTLARGLLESPATGPRKVQPYLCGTAEQALSVLAWLEAQPAYGADTETCPGDSGKEATDWATCGLLGISLAATSEVGYWIPRDVLEDPEVHAAVCRLLGDATKLVWMHNAKFDLHVLQRFFCPVRGVIRDTMLLAQHAQTGMALGLKPQAMIRLGAQKWDDAVASKMKDLRKADPVDLGVYAATDALHTVGLGQVLPVPQTLAYRTASRALACLQRMEQRGVMVDTQVLDQMHQVVAGRTEHYYQAMVEAIDNHQTRNGTVNPVNPLTFNAGSPKQVGDVLYRIMGFPILKSTAGGSASTDAETVENLRASASAVDQGEEFMSSLLLFRKAEKIRGTYVEPLRGKLRSDGAVSCSYSIVGAVSGRLSCVAWDTVLETSLGPMRISDLDLANVQNISIMTHTGSWRRVKRLIYKGEQEMFRVSLKTGEWVICSADHKLLTPSGWRLVGGLKVGEEVSRTTDTHWKGHAVSNGVRHQQTGLRTGVPGRLSNGGSYLCGLAGQQRHSTGFHTLLPWLLRDTVPQETEQNQGGVTGSTEEPRQVGLPNQWKMVGHQRGPIRRPLRQRDSHAPYYGEGTRGVVPCQRHVSEGVPTKVRGSDETAPKEQPFPSIAGERPRGVRGYPQAPAGKGTPRNGRERSRSASNCCSLRGVSPDSNQELGGHRVEFGRQDAPAACGSILIGTVRPGKGVPGDTGLSAAVLCRPNPVLRGALSRVPSGEHDPLVDPRPQPRVWYLSGEEQDSTQSCVLGEEQAGVDSVPSATPCGGSTRQAVRPAKQEDAGLRLPGVHIGSGSRRQCPRLLRFSEGQGRCEGSRTDTHGVGTTSVLSNRGGGGHVWGSTQDTSHDSGQVVAIESVGVEGVWDIEVDGDHSYVAQGLIHHNCSDPNLQNQPVCLRPMFVARPGYTFVDCDYAQLEVVVGAALSHDEAMIQAVINAADDKRRYLGERDKYQAWVSQVESHFGGSLNLQTIDPVNRELVTRTFGWLDPPVPPFDVHRMIAAAVLGKRPEDVSGDERREIKAVTFGIMYGKDIFTLTRDFGGDEAKAKEVWDVFFGNFPGFGKYIEKTHATAVRRGEVVSPFGRRYSLPLARFSSRRHGGSNNLYAIGQESLRQAVNWPIQGTAGYVCLERMCDAEEELAAAGIDGWPAVTVHDSVVYEVQENDLGNATRIVVAAMQRPFPELLNIPLMVDYKVYRHWGGDYDEAELVKFMSIED